jgi:hypothetical protein
MNKTINSYSLCFFSLYSLCLCGSFSSAAEPPKTNYADHVLPVLREKCLGCHNAEKSKGGLDLSNYVKLMSGGSSGAVIKPGDPDDSRLFLLAAHKAEPMMPPQGGPLAAAGLDTIRKWIREGAPETAGSKVVIANKPKSEVSLVSITRGRPAGPPPMPTGSLAQSVLRTSKPAAVTALAASPWAPLVAVAASKQVLLIHTESWHLLGTLPFEHGQVNVLKFSRNGQLLLAGGGRGGKAGKAVVWNVADGKVVIEVGEEHDAVLAADISADHTQIALGGPGKVIRVFSTKDGEKLREIKKHTDWVTAIEYSPDGVLLASGDRSSGLYVWEAFTGREYFALRGPKAAVTDVSWQADSNVLAAASEDGTVKLFEMENGKQTKTWNAHGGGVQSVRHSHDGRLVTCGRDALTKVWDGSGTLKKAMESLTDLATRAAFTHDDAAVVAGDLQGRLRVWSAADGARLSEFTTTPLAPADQLVATRKLLESKTAELPKLTAALAAATAAAQKANAELAAAQKAAADTANISKVIADALADAKPAAERVAAAVPAAQAVVQARDVTAKAFAEAAAKIKAAADAAPTNKDLVQSAQQAQQTAAKAAADLTAAQKALADAQAAAKATADRVAAAQKAAADTAGPVEAAKQALAAKQPAAKAANDALAAATTVKERLEREIQAARVSIERLQTVVASK